MWSGKPSGRHARGLATVSKHAGGQGRRVSSVYLPTHLTKPRNLWLKIDWIVYAVLLSIVFSVMFGFYRIPSASMTPSLEVGGTYIGGALPCLSAAVSVGWKQAAAVLAFIVVYQQVENLALSPAVSRATLSLNPAVSLLAVMAGGSLAGALGAFLAIPVASSVKAVLSQYAVAHGEEAGPAGGGVDAGADGLVTTDKAQNADART